jgi:hypothetical protein
LIKYLILYLCQLIGFLPHFLLVLPDQFRLDLADIAVGLLQLVVELESLPALNDQIVLFEVDSVDYAGVPLAHPPLKQPLKTGLATLHYILHHLHLDLLHLLHQVVVLGYPLLDHCCYLRQRTET